MKVISDIINYLHFRGHLNDDDVKFYADNGVIPHQYPDLWEYMELEEAENKKHGLDKIDDQIDLYPSQRRGGKSRGSQRNLITAKCISSRIIERWPEWSNTLNPLKDFADAIKHVSDVSEALHVINSADNNSIDDAVERVLADQAFVSNLWLAMSFQDYNYDIVYSGERGRAVQSYKSILAITPHEELGRYTYALRHPGLARLLQIVQAQSILFKSFGRILKSTPILFDRILSNKHYNAIAYWSLTLVFSGRVQLGDRSNLPMVLHEPRRPLPCGATEKQIWSCAMSIDRANVSSLLVRYARKCHDLDRHSHGWEEFYIDSSKRTFFEAAKQYEIELYCPAKWDLGYGGLSLVETEPALDD